MMENQSINYNEQMLNYYPEVIKAIQDFRALIATQSLQVEDLHNELTKVLENAYITTADEDRLSMWEKSLGITPLPQGEDDLETWKQQRRDTILARLYSPQKLNTQSISSIVQIFTGGTAKSYFDPTTSTITVTITPPKDNRQYKFANIEQELRKKVPAHLIIQVDRNYYTWLETKETYETWRDVLNNEDKLRTWEDILLSIPNLT